MKRDTTASRRRFLQATGTLGIGSAITLAGCVGSGGSSNGSGAANSSTNNSAGGDASIREKYGLPELDYELENTLNVFQWSDYWPTDTVKNFEKAYGVKVNVSNFGSNSEMFSKLKAGGSGQFDVVFPSRNMIKILTSQNLIQQIDVNKIPTWDNLQKEWRGENSGVVDGQYIIPYMWGTSGVSWNSNMVDDLGDTLSWDVMWNEKYEGQLVMMNSARECFTASLARLGYSINTKDQSKIDEAKNELIKQKPLLKAYNSINSSEFLQNKTASPINAWNDSTLQAYNALKENSQSPIKYAIPKEGAMKWLDTMVITKKARNVNTAHAFGAYILNAQIGANIAKYAGSVTPNKAAKQHMPDSRTDNPIVSQFNPGMERLEFMNKFSDSPEVAKYYSTAWTEIQNA